MFNFISKSAWQIFESLFIILVVLGLYVIDDNDINDRERLESYGLGKWR
jgi:hypothetical protein